MLGRGWFSSGSSHRTTETAAQEAPRETEQERANKQDDEKKKKLDFVSKIGEEVVGNPDRRVLWLELLHAINHALPKNTRPQSE